MQAYPLIGIRAKKKIAWLMQVKRPVLWVFGASKALLMLRSSGSVCRKSYLLIACIFGKQSDTAKLCESFIVISYWDGW